MDLYSIKELLLSDGLLSNQENIELMVKYLTIHEYPNLKTTQKYYYSLYMTVEDLEFDSHKCLNVKNKFSSFSNRATTF